MQNKRFKKSSIFYVIWSKHIKLVATPPAFHSWKHTQVAIFTFWGQKCGPYCSKIRLAEWPRMGWPRLDVKNSTNIIVALWQSREETPKLLSMLWNYVSTKVEQSQSQEMWWYDGACVFSQCLEKRKRNGKNRVLNSEAVKIATHTHHGNIFPANHKT